MLYPYFYTNCLREILIFIWFYEASCTQLSKPVTVVIAPPTAPNASHKLGSFFINSGFCPV
jgi:hypothetical protein